MHGIILCASMGTSLEQKVIGKTVVGATPLFFRSLTLTPKYCPVHN